MTESSSGGARKGGSHGLAITGIVTCLFVIYLLSAGPIVKLMINGSLDPEGLVIEWYLAPLYWLYTNVPPFRMFYDWYLPLFNR